MFSNPHRRRHYFINANLQLRYSIYVFITLLLVSVASCLFLSFGAWNLIINEFSDHKIQNRLEMASRINDYNQARQNSQNSNQGRLAEFQEVENFSIREKEILQEILKQNNKELAVWVIILFLLIATGTIFLTHKIAGPLFRLKRTFVRIKNGDLKQRVYLRRGDQAQELMPELNAMISSLDYSFSKIKALNKKIEHALENDIIPKNEIFKYQQKITKEINRYETSDAYKSV